MTLYFRRFKIRNPLRPCHKSYLETVLAAEAAEKKEKEKAEERAAKQRVSNSLRCQTWTIAKMIQRKSLAQFEGRETTWHRAVRRARSLWLPKIPQGEEVVSLEGEEEDEEEYDGQEDDENWATSEEAGEEVVWGEWEGDWSEILEYYV